MATLERFFPPAQRAAVEAAVRDAEARTSGEIVPVAVARCADYPHVDFAAALLGALLGGAGAAAALELGELWVARPALWTLVAALVGAAAGTLLARVPSLARLLVGAEAITAAVDQRAFREFVEHEVFSTRERTGILILVALFERRVAILADAGINAKVRQEEWDAVAAGIVAGIRAGRPGEALAAGIRRCGELLERGGVERRADDTDELSDRLRLEER